MNKLKGDCLLVIIQEFYCTNTCEYTNIASCRGKVVLDSSRLKEEIFVYTLVKLYNKANLLLKQRFFSIGPHSNIYNCHLLHVY